MNQLNRRSIMKLGAFGGLAMTGLAACSGVGSSSPAVQGKTSVRYGFWGNNVRQQNYTKALEAFQESNQDVSVEIEFADYTAFQERMTTQMAARNVPDIFWIAAPQVRTYEKSGIYHDLEGIETIKLDDFGADDLEGFKLAGKLNTMPFGIFVPVLRYNQTLVESVGASLPDEGQGWTWNALAELAIDVSKSNKGIKGLPYNGDADLPFESWLRQHGEQLWTDDGQVGFSVDKTAAWLDWWDKLQKAGGCMTISEQDGVAPDWQLIGNKVLMNFGNSNHIIDDAKAFPDMTFDLRHMPVNGTPVDGYQYLYTPRMAIYANLPKERLGAAGSVINFNVNDVEMLKIVGLTMGAPTNPRVAEEIVAFASENEKSMLRVVAEDRAVSSRKPRYEAPAGSSTWRTTMSRACEEVSLGKSTPAKAAEAMISEIKAGIQRAA